MFQSDFRAVAEFFVQKRNKNSNPKRAVLKHVDEVMKLLSVYNDDKRYEEVLACFSESEKGGLTMCEVIDKYIEQGMKQRDEEFKTALELKDSGNTDIDNYRKMGISDEVIKIVLRIDELD